MLRGSILSLAFSVVLTLVSYAADPVVKGETKVKRDSLVTLSVPATKDVAVTWRITPSAGVTKAPNQPAGQLVFNGSPGTYQVDVLVIDWVNRTIGETSETVVIGDAPGKPDDPVKPPPSGKFFFVIIRPAQATEEYKRLMSFPAWSDTIEKGGHGYKDYTIADAPKWLTIPPNTRLPAVFTAAKDSAGTWQVIGSPVDLPASNDGVKALVK